MRIGLISPYDYSFPGGVTKHVKDLSNWLIRYGHYVKIIAPSTDIDIEQKDPLVYRIGRAIPIPANQSVARIGLSFHLTNRLRHILIKEQFDVLHFHEPLMPALPLAALAASTSANVGTFHAFAGQSLGYYYGRPFFKPYFEKLHCLIAVSEPAKQFISRYFKGEYHVISNGIDLERFNPSVPPRPEFEDGMLNILFVGRLEKRKGITYLLKAFTKVKQELPRSRLIIVGAGPMLHNVENFVYEHKLSDVVLKGFVPDPELPSYYRSAHIFCAPATGKESFGIVLLEAIACGTPVVATNISGFRQIITHGKEGFLVKPKSENELAAALVALGSSPSLREKMAKSAASTSLQYSWEEISRKIIDIYYLAIEKSKVGLHSGIGK